MYNTTDTYLYVKKNKLCKKQNPNTLANPTRIINLQGIPTLQLNNVQPTPPTCPTNIDPNYTTISPFYEAYTIDPSGALFGQTLYPCTIDTWKKYLVYPKCSNG